MKHRISLSMLLLCLLLQIQTVGAEDHTEIEKPDFNTKMVKHEYQMNNNVNYFHLPIDKSYEEKPLEIVVHNESLEPQEILLEFHTAQTNMSGYITYDGKEYGPNETLPINIEERIEIENPIRTVAPQSSETYKILFDTENIGEINGIALGGFTVSKLNYNQTKGGIGNEFKYRIALVATDQITSVLPKSKKLDMTSAKLLLLDGRKTILYQIENLEAQMADELNLTAELISNKNNKSVIKSEELGLSIAPNGILPHYLDWGKLDVKPGDYTLKVSVNDGKNEYNWEQGIKINQTEAKEINQNSLNKITIPMWAYFFSIVLLILTIINHLILRKDKD